MVRREEISLIHEYLIETASWHLGRDSWGQLVLVRLHSPMQRPAWSLSSQQRTAGDGGQATKQINFHCVPESQANDGW